MRKYHAGMVHERLRFALEQVTSGDWLIFERLCSEFLVDEFPAIRTTATPSGDGGRDGELFAIPGEERTGFQYSVSTDWNSKIRRTVATVQANGFHYGLLIYCSSQAIGAKADALKQELWKKHGLLLDVRDREWFCERELHSPAREAAAAQFCRMLVDPIVSARGIASVAGSPLALEEGRVALVQLALNSSDRLGDTNLTKTSFDALVQSALLDSTQDNALDVQTIIQKVRLLVPHGAENQVKSLVESALVRLSQKRGPVKHLRVDGRFHLSYEATEKWRTAAADYLLDQQALEVDLADAANGFDADLDSNPSALQSEGQALRAALEAVMLRSGEQFVAAVEGGDTRMLTRQSVSEAIVALGSSLRLHPDDAATVVMEVLSTPSARTRTHLLRVLDAYTLMAFLQQTPDVQKALSRVFDNGKVWLDTSAVLPLLAETLIDEPEQRLQTVLLRAAVDSGLALRVTDGVIEELRFHLERCITYLHAGSSWDAEVPFIFSAYMLSGRDERQFSDWVSNFRGLINPEQDIEEYLQAVFSIERHDLKEAAEKADVKLRGATSELFRRKHFGGYRAGRTRRSRLRSENIIDRLAAHDVESALGVIQLRRESRLPLGHEAWWLTLDKTAFKLGAWLRDQLGRDAPDTPALSPDYLSQMLRLGPIRRTVAADVTRLPLVIDVTRLESVPVELIDAARKTREIMAGFDEVRIRREVRDELHRLRTTMRAGHDYASDMHQAVTEGLKRTDV
jgi:hypothetical protein